MTGREVEDIFIARTDNDPEYGAFYARPRQSGEQGHIYGPDIYARFFTEL